MTALAFRALLGLAARCRRLFRYRLELIDDDRHAASSNQLNQNEPLTPPPSDALRPTPADTAGGWMLAPALTPIDAPPFAPTDAPAPIEMPAFRSTSCPADMRNGSSMPLALAIDCQSLLPFWAAMFCSESPLFALFSGFCPGCAGTLPSPLKVVSRIFCCDSVRVIAARSGLPSGEKNSSDCSKPSTMPSKMNEPHRKRTPGGASFLGSASDFCGVMKKMTFWVSRRTSSTGSFSIAVTSNHNCSA